MLSGTTIELIDLLRRREAEFVTIWKCEREICDMLSMPDYPFTPPPELPSRRKNPRAQLRRNAVNKTASAKIVRKKSVRSLVPGVENAYKLVFTYNGKCEESYQKERELIELLLNVSSKDLKLTSVEAGKFVSMEEWHGTELLWPVGE